MSASASAESLSRRDVSSRQPATTAIALAAHMPRQLTLADKPTEQHQATGVRVGEITSTSAIIWTRLTKHATRNNEGVVFRGKGASQDPATVDMPVSEIEGACPGQAGEIRIRDIHHSRGRVKRMNLRVA
jgi:phosphodiesterase/alkaline phosphatase D-like protein